jgi:peptidoglycan/LPS O-acetylase OafA/YrhL
MRLPARHTSLRGIDVSYGVYVYAFPVQQLMSGYCLDRELGVWVAMAGAAAITLLLAAASWHLIEKPALGLKGRFTAPARPPR